MAREETRHKLQRHIITIRDVSSILSLKVRFLLGGPSCTQCGTKISDSRKDNVGHSKPHLNIWGNLPVSLENCQELFRELADDRRGPTLQVGPFEGSILCLGVYCSVWLLLPVTWCLMSMCDVMCGCALAQMLLTQ